MSGFGCSGSSVVVDWAREYDGCYALDGEFDLFRNPDGVQDLRCALTSRVSLRRCYLAMVRFERLVTVMARQPGRVFGRDYERKTYDGFAAHMRAFLGELTAVHYPAGSTATWIEKHAELSPHGQFIDESSVGRRMREFVAKLHESAKYGSKAKAARARLFLRLLGHPRRTERKEMYQPISLTGAEFDAIARRYFDDMVRRIGPADKTHLVLDQAIGPTGMPGGLDLISDCRAVVVHRDPRDVFMSGLTKERHWVPTASAEDFARWFSIAMPQIHLQDPRICVVGFEDLVIAPERHFGYLERFLGWNAGAKRAPGSHFDPEVSRQNVGKWKQHPDQELMAQVARLCRPRYEAMRENNTPIPSA